MDLTINPALKLIVLLSESEVTGTLTSIKSVSSQLS